MILAVGLAAPPFPRRSGCSALGAQRLKMLEDALSDTRATTVTASSSPATIGAAVPRSHGGRRLRRAGLSEPAALGDAAVGALLLCHQWAVILVCCGTCPPLVLWRGAYVVCRVDPTTAVCSRMCWWRDGGAVRSGGAGP